MHEYNSIIGTVVHKNVAPEKLKKQALESGRAKEDEHGVLVINTGKFTGRSPKDKFFVNEESQVFWNEFNMPIEEKYFSKIKEDILEHINSKPEVWMREVYAGADPDNRIALSIYTEFPEANLFVSNMFIERDDDFQSEWTVIQVPDFKADPKIHGTRQENFAVISLKQKTILIGGTAYTGEIKKGVFSVMNYLLPVNKEILAMHCSANIGDDGDVALFFGLSGTGKTTLSTDTHRYLIGDDEHGWSDKGVFNFEGGCYAKVVDLSEKKEPQIFRAIRDNALVENVVFKPNTKTIDFESREITENTRVSYPIDYIEGAIIPSVGGTPKNIFFLTCDAFGVMPPISKLSTEQAMFYFLSGYTAKIAGTEEGVKEPFPTFSTCFGAPFLPLNPKVYDDLLGAKLRKFNCNVWMINTGWTGGGYGVGERIKLANTRAMIKAVFDNKLNGVIFQKHPIFGLDMPLSCPGVPSNILNPVLTWENKEEYEKAASALAEKFLDNFERFETKIEHGIKLKNLELI